MLDETRAKRLDESVDRLEDLSVFDTAPIEELSYYRTRSFADPEELPLSAFEPCEVGFAWDRNRENVPDDRRDAAVDVTRGDALPEALAVGENVWFRLRFSIPESMAGRPVSLQFAVDPVGADEGAMGPPRVECLCYRDGEPWQAFDDGHRELRLTDEADGGETFDLLIEAGTTTLWGLLDVDRFRLEAAHLSAAREPVRELATHYTVLDELRRDIDPESPNWGKVTRALVEASHAFAFDADDEAEYDRTARAALDRLRDLENGLSSDLTGYELTAVGHAHIDLAWLWPWSETVRKGARSFSNVLKLMEEYPAFTFIQSQPHLYEFLRNRYPDVHERIADRVETGDWQPTGALWVESDVNLAGGEALARQFLLGKRYFREEFDVDPRITFIPDVFGYSAALPAIADAADCPYFLTQKMSWNEINDFPHTTFEWEGLGGSSVLAHFPPADTYNGDFSVEQVRRSVTNNDQNDRLEESAYLFGWGDGGGGPTREMLERASVVDDVGSLPDVSFGSLREFFDRVAAADADLPTWVGELYLEIHRGTLTTQARTKRNNRKGEFALREAELWSALALAAADADFEYPHDDLERAWKALLFHQFHDILPGSSVTEVYADADRDYEQVFETAEAVTERAREALFGATDAAGTVCVTNSLPWERRPVVAVDSEDLAIGGDDAVPVNDPPAPAAEEMVAIAEDGDRLPVQAAAGDDGDYLVRPASVPALGATSLEFAPADEAVADEAAETDSPLSVSESHLENDRLRVEFADDGTIRARDAATGRDLFDGAGNRLVSYRDHPDEWDAWDIDGDVYAVGEDLPAPDEVEVVESGPIRATVRQTRRFGDSTLVQDVSLTRDSARIDFRTTVDWHEDERLLKAHFPTAVHASSAAYDVQFGHVERDTHDNTSWDAARFEEPHQQWVDVSEYDYGVAVLNDCKYGVHVDGTDVSLSLLRAPASPDPEADRGRHEFAYAVYPHEGDLQAGGVVEEGYEFNVPAHAVPVEDSVSLEPFAVDAEGVVVESIKRAEDGADALVVRLYEAYGRATDATLTFDLPVVGAAETNLIEDHERDLTVSDGSVDLSLDAFDIRTIRLDLG
ncbi:MAG: alpha-mannosidase [Haloarculaceae archaeon]